MKSFPLFFLAISFIRRLNLTWESLNLPLSLFLISDSLWAKCSFSKALVKKRNLKEKEHIMSHL